MYRVFHRKCRYEIKTCFYLHVLRATLLNFGLSKSLSLTWPTLMVSRMIIILK